MRSFKKSLNQLFDWVLTFVLLMISGIATRFFSWLFLDVYVIGRHNVPNKKEGVLYAPNHITLIDPWFVMSYMKSLVYIFFQIGILPWNTPEFKNYFKTATMQFFFKHLRCIPVKRGVMKPSELENFLNKVSDTLKTGNLLIFPEGTRTRTGEIGQGKQGIGKIIYENHCKVVPVKIIGLEKILPIGAKMVTISFLKRKKVTIIYGEPLDFTDFYKLPPNKETYLKISAYLIEIINALQPD